MTAILSPKSLLMACFIGSESMKSQSVSTEKIGCFDNMPTACITGSENLKSQSEGTRKILCSDTWPIVKVILNLISIAKVLQDHR